MNQAEEYPIIAFADIAAFEQWIHENHTQPGVWIKIAKKASGIASIAHDEALDVALCYGWIDGQRNGLNDTHFLQKFTPRRPRSLWSKRNVAKIATLAAAGKMQPSGELEVEAAKQDGRWDAAYDSSKDMVVPEDFLRALAKNKKAHDFFRTLNRTNVYAIAFRLVTAKKPETRQRRFDALLTMLEKGDKLY